MAARAARNFGSVPRSRVSVRLQNVNGQGERDQTLTFNVYGQDYNDVKDIIEAALEGAYGATEEEETEEPDEPQRPARAVVRRRKTAR